MHLATATGKSDPVPAVPGEESAAVAVADSKLDEMPPGRQPIDTRVVAVERQEDVVAAIARHLQSGQQAYWVCPMVRENENEDLAAAEARFAELQAHLGDAVVLVHGQLRPEVKDAAMERFASGEAKLLVATTVIEVGVDVPNATLMVIEQAERFGLALAMIFPIVMFVLAGVISAVVANRNKKQEIKDAENYPATAPVVTMDVVP